MGSLAVRYPFTGNLHPDRYIPPVWFGIMYLRTQIVIEMNKILLLLLLMASRPALSQQLPEKDPQHENVFIRVEKMPVFPGEEGALFTYLSKELKYPQSALDKKIEGKVFLSFIVDTKGKISDVSVLRGVHPDIDKEAVRMVKSMPDWKPGTQNGVPVNVRFTLPINFRLN